MKKIYAVIQSETGKGRCAWVYDFSSSLNVSSIFQSSNAFKEFNVFMIADSKKKAFEIADAWNESFKKNGTYDV